MCKISVIVPVYKVEPYLNQCVESILNQSFPDFELILVDDGSPDNSGAMCDEWAKKDSRIQVIHKENGGVSAARNTGLDIAQGEYVTFCDSDDYWERDFLLLLYQDARQHNSDISACGFTNVISPRNRQEYLKKSYCLHFQNSNDLQQYLHTRLLCYVDGWSVCCRLFRMDIIRKNNIRFCTNCNNFAEDMGFVANCVLHAQTISSVDHCLYNYIWHPGSMMDKSEKIARLNDMNEVSFYLGQEYSATRMGSDWKKYRAISHFLIMYNQYQKIFWTESQKDLPALLKTIEKADWFRCNTRSLFGACRLLKTYFGKDDARRILMFAGYCLHRSWPLYRITRGFYNKLFGYRKEGG